MSVNRSKANDLRFWRRWQSSGAVSSRMSRLWPATAGGLPIDAVGTDFVRGTQTLTLGMRVVRSGPDWSVSEPVMAIVVPNRNYQAGTRLPRIPRDAVPVEEFYATAR